MTPIASLWTRHRLSQDHLLSAHALSEDAREVEHSATPDTWSTVAVRHFASVSSAIFLSVAFLESAANEIFADSCALMPVGLRTVDHATVGRMKELWKLGIPRTAQYPVLGKYQLALAAACKPAMPLGAEPAQSVALLVRLRNALIHYEAEWIETPYDGKGHDSADKMTRMLEGRFQPLNMVPATEPLWPIRCFSADCARWAVSSTIAFSQEFLRQFGAFQPYVSVRDRLPGGCGTGDAPA